jgi:hypothetical protein
MPLAPVSIALLLATIPVGQVRARESVFAGDRDLAQSPVILLAQWGGAVRTVGNETAIGLNAVSVLRGGPLADRVEVALPFGSEPMPEHGKVTVDATTGERLGRIADLRVPGIWFCKQQGDLLGMADLAFGVQDASLLPYFRAILADQPVPALCELLGSDPTADVGKAVVGYLCGGVLPWPWERVRSQQKRRVWSPASDPLATDTLRTLWQGADEEARSLYLAAWLTLQRGQANLELVAAQTRNGDPDTRLIALGTLLRVGVLDTITADQVREAVRDDPPSPLVAWRFLDEVRLRPDGGTLKALSSFLELDERAPDEYPADTTSLSWTDEAERPDAGLDVSEDLALRLPCVRARHMLNAVTGLWVPFDRSRGWEVLGSWLDGGRQPETRPGAFRCPFIVDAVLSGRRVCITLALQANEPVAVTLLPGRYVVSHQGVLQTVASVAGHSDPRRRGDLALLSPGMPYAFALDVPPDVALGPGTVHITLQYLSLARGLGLNTWVGTVGAELARP